MKLRLLFTLITFFAVLTKMESQILTFDFNGLVGNEITANSNFNNVNLANSIISRGSGLNAANNGNRFNANNWALASIVTAVAGDDYMEFTVTPNAGYSFNVTNIAINFQRSGTGTRGLALRSSNDTFLTNIDGEKVVADNTSVQTFTFTVNATNNTGALTFRVYGWAESTGGSGGFEGGGNDIVVNGSVYLNTPQPEINITGNAISIADNDTTPQTADFTDFGDVDVTSGAQINSFVIENTGTANLTLSGTPIVDVTGTNATDFVVSAQATTPIASAGNSTFSVTFNPSAAGTRTATISVANNDGDENPYEFAIQGNGTTPCVAPTTQATNLTFSNITSNSLDGNFTATTADGYLIVQSASSTLSANPVNGTTYNTGDALGGGIVVASGTGTTFSASGLTASSTYYYFVIAYNNLNCVGGITYNSTAPLTNNETTLSGPCLGESFTGTTFQPTGWLVTGVARSTSATDYNTVPAAAIFNSANGFLTTSVIANPSSLSFYLERTGSTVAKTLNIKVSTVSQTGPFTTVQSYTNANVTTTYQQYTVDLSAYSTASNVWIQFEKISTTTARWRLDDVEVFCASACTPTHTISGFTPLSGPAETEVTITGTGFTAASTVSVNNLSATIISQTATSIVAAIPTGVSSGVISVNEGGCDAVSSSSFTVINESGACTSSSFSDLIISEVFDSNAGNAWYMELYNPTSNPIDLNAAGTDFQIERFPSIGDPSPSRVIDLIGTVAGNSVFSIKVGSASPDPCSATAFDFELLGSGINENDEIRLTKNGTAYDVVYCPNETGYSITRNNTSVGPSATYSAADWTTNSSETCADLGTYAAVPSTFPVVTTQPIDIGACDTMASLSIAAAPGNSGTLTYQWYFNNGTASGWTAVTNAAFMFVTVSGETTNTLSFNGPLAIYSGFQFYCEVSENGVCTTASDAAQLKNEFTTWDGTAWDNGTPTISTAVVLNGDYNTGTNGSFSGCSLIVNSVASLTVAANSYVEITNDILNNGVLIVQDKGSVVQINDASTYNDSGSSAAVPTKVKKNTAPINNWYEYTYWSSPVANETIGNGLASSNPSRRFWFEANNYVDTYYENNNDNTQTYGPATDGVDDDNNVWQLATAGSVMTPGVGYIASHSSGNMVAGQTQYLYDFEGDLNTGVITVPIERNDTEINDYNWNLIGNPYASAISIDAFFNANRYDVAATGRIEAEVYLWTHTTAPSATTNGNEQYNFNLLDYGTVNATGELAGGDLNNDGAVNAADIPVRYIASCQSFLVKYSQVPATTTGNAVFNNSMRHTGNNQQFFKTGLSTATPNKLWLNLSSDYGVYNQTLIGYVNGATNNLDSGAFDSKKIGLYKTSIGFYSLVQDNATSVPLAIQGKAPSALHLDEVIPLGFKNDVSVPTIFKITIDKLQGEFLTNNTIYLKDKYLNTYTNLNETDYSFTSEVGTFNDRFEVVFKMESLSITNFDSATTTLTIVALDNGMISFNTNTNETIKSITIYNTLGQRIYSDKTLNASVVNVSLKGLSTAMYVAEVTLSNGKTLIKKGIKK